jgi:hypothetical protein
LTTCYAAARRTSTLNTREPWLRLRSLTALLACALVTGCGSPHSGARAPDAAASGPGRDGEWFADRTEQAGLAFQHVNGMSGKFYYAEIMAPGAAMFDYDNDGDLDTYLVQGQMLGDGKALFPPESPLPLEGRLYRNDLEIHADGTRTLTFTDVTRQSGITARGYGMGVAAGDFNNDGCVDLYLTNLGRNQLFRNNCDGTFTDVSKQSGTDDPGWSVSAAFVDFDRDGWLDLYVGHYLDWSVQSNRSCLGPSGGLAYCPPSVYRAQPSRLYHNNRDGTFSDVTARAGMTAQFGPALGVVAADFNGDGWIDLYVTNDGQPNLLWINQRDGTFKNTGLLSGAALSARGKAKAGMGVDAGDVDNDGDEDLFVTNLMGEGHDLYINDGSGLFENQSARSGLGSRSLPYTGFGTGWFDFDNDGWLDILTVNGAVQTIEALKAIHDPFPLAQRKQLFRNLGNGQFEDVTSLAGRAFQLPGVGRGAAFGDIDNDGDVDVLVANNNGKAQLLINDIGNRNHWLGLRLVGEPGSRDMLGARVGVFRRTGPTLWRRSRADGSYASANDPRVLVGLGASMEAPRVQVVWPSGRTEEWRDVAIDRYATLKEGAGSAR